MDLRTPKFSLTLLSALIISTLTACGGSGSGSDGPQSPIVNDDMTLAKGDGSGVILSVSEYGDIFTGKPFVLSYELTPTVESILSKDTRSFSVSARYGEVTDTNPLTGEPAPQGTLYYFMPETALENTPEFYHFQEEFTVNNGDSEASVYTLNVGTNTEHGDPLFTDQWNLKNLGQNPFEVELPPVKGIDINVIPAWHLKDAQSNLISGKNVRICVYDDPVDIVHEDLKNKIHDPVIPKDYINKGLTLEDLEKEPLSYHGTAVAGIIGAEAGGKGVRGIAYESSIISYDSDGVEFDDLTDRENFDIINASLGVDDSSVYSPSIEMYDTTLFENGIPFIKAAGNEFGEADFEPARIYPTSCVEYEVNCQYNQTSSFNRARHVINVGAINSLGEKASYSSTGSYLWVSGFGGESGHEGIPDPDSSAATVTTLTSFDPKLYEDPDEFTPWRKDQTMYDLRKFYTQGMSGTSSATPTVTGVAALVKQAKPEITVPQLKYILAVTARNDKSPGWDSLAYSEVRDTVPEYDDEYVTFDYGWHAVGSSSALHDTLRFANYYGFGVVDAHKAVLKAQQCDEDQHCAKRSELPNDYFSSNEDPCSSEDGGFTVTCSLTELINAEDENPPESAMEIENVSLDVISLRYATSDNHYCSLAHSGNMIGIASANNLLQITIKSPDGTVSLVKPVYANWDFNGKKIQEQYSSDAAFLINSSDFYTEKVSATDTFTVEFMSGCPIDVSKLNDDFSIVVTGYEDSGS